MKMSLAENYGERVAGNFVGVFVAIIVGVFSIIGESMAQATDTTTTSSHILLGTVQAYPAIITLVGLFVVVAAAGPIGFIGYLFETTGISLFLTNPRPALVLMLLGSAIIVIGAKVWKWRYVLEWLNSSSHGGMRRR